MTTKGATLPKAGHWLAPRGKPMNTLTDRPLDLGSARPDGLLARAPTAWTWRRDSRA